MARKKPSSAQSKAEVPDDESPLNKMLDFLEAIEREINKHEAKNGKSLESQEARKLLHLQRFGISLAPDSSKLVFQMTGNAIALGAAIMKLEAANLQELWDREKKRRKNAGRRPGIDPSHIDLLRLRAAMAAEIDPSKKPSELVRENCVWYNAQYRENKTPVSERTMKAVIDGK